MTTENTKHQWIDRKGIFRGQPIEAKVITGADDSQSVGLHVTCEIVDALDGSNWDDWAQYGFIAAGTLWIIGRDGTINEQAAVKAQDALGWDGNLEHVDAGKLKACQFTVDEEEYKDKTHYRISWFNPFDWKPGPKPLPPDEVKKLSREHGAKLRALLGQRKSNAPASPAPPARPTTKPPKTTAKSDERQIKDGVEALDHIRKAYKKNDVTEDELEEKLQTAKTKVSKESGKEEADFGPEEWSTVVEDAAIPF